MATFTDALATARRKALVTGRPLTTGETAGITAGYAGAATDRAVADKQARLQEIMQDKDLAARRAEQEAELALRREQLAAQNEQAYLDRQDQQKQQNQEDAASGATLLGSLVGSAAGGPYGAAAGIGYYLGYSIVSNNSHLCTEVSRVLGINEDRRWDIFKEFRQFCVERYPASFKVYINNGWRIIDGIRRENLGPGEYAVWWATFEKEIIEPMMPTGDRTPAFLRYIDCVVRELIPTYAPQLVDDITAAWENDTKEVA